MDANRLSRLKDLYQAETWGGGTSPDEVRVDANLGAALLPGWSLLDRSQETSDEGAAQTILLRSDNEEQEQVLQLDVLQYTDPQAAQQGLLYLLDQFEGPPPERYEAEEAPGDVAFSTPSGYVTLFVQGNVVVRVSNAGRDLVPSAGVAASVSKALRR